ncbi:MAG TPA: DUF3060 domain-containing protein [Humibacter sp.]|jgi:hypothetical protein|nr:DUF3060 domain-containing protein [Humibacter sp.]
MPTRLHAALRAVTMVIAGATLVALAGCSSTTAPSDDVTHYSTGGSHHCSAGESIEIDGASRTHVITGDCGTVVVKGDGNTVRIDRAASLDVEGESDSVTLAGRVGSVVLKGNGIALGAQSIGSVKVTGQNNSVTAPALGAVMIQGDHNVVTTHTKPSDYRASGQDDTLTLH